MPQSKVNLCYILCLKLYINVNLVIYCGIITNKINNKKAHIQI